MSKKYTLSTSKTKKDSETDAWPRITADERAMIQDIFHKMDKNHNGAIDQYELESTLEELGLPKTASASLLKELGSTTFFF
eukprot:gene5586-9402_t